MPTSYVGLVAKRKQLNPGDLVLSLGDDATDLRFKSGVIIGIAAPEADDHVACNNRLTILWVSGRVPITQECDCGIIVPLDLETGSIRR